MARGTHCNCGFTQPFIENIFVDLSDANNLCGSNPLCGAYPLCGIDFAEFADFKEFRDFSEIVDLRDFTGFMSNPFGDEEIPEVTAAATASATAAATVAAAANGSPTKENTEATLSKDLSSSPGKDTSNDAVAPTEGGSEEPELQNVLDRKLEDVEKWKKRLEREEVFSLRYQPTSEEKKELEDVANELQLPLGGLSGLSKIVAGLTSPTAAKNMQSVKELIEPDSGHPASILLLRGPVVWKRYQQENSKDSVEPKQSELLLFTHGFVISKTSNGDSGTCKMWKAVDRVMDMVCVKDRPSTSNDFSFGIDCIAKGGNRLVEFQVESAESKQVWMDALERIMVQHTMHNKERQEQTERLGWQYERVIVPGFSAAVSGNLDQLGAPSDDEANAKSWNTLDRYQEYAPLHYAVQQEELNIAVVEALMQSGADPNLPDGEGRSSMYYAERDQLTHLRNVLASHGGKKSKKAAAEIKGFLFGGVAEASRRTEERRKKEKDAKAAEAERKADVAKSEMNKNMSALNERGDKIRELSDKTADLENEAKSFKDMAAQLKNQAMKKKWYHR